MRFFRKLTSIMIASLMIASVATATAMAADADDDGMNMYENSDFIEKEQPELTEETKQLISLYQRNPTQENYLNLRDIVIDNYNAVLVRKEAKLAELKEETAGKPGGLARLPRWKKSCRKCTSHIGIVSTAVC